MREQSRLQYQAAVLTAFQEVSNALVAREKYAQVRAQQARGVEAYQVAVEVSRQPYVAGRAGYFEVLQEQQLLFPAENSLVHNPEALGLAVLSLDFGNELFECRFIRRARPQPLPINLLPGKIRADSHRLLRFRVSTPET